MLHSCKKYWKPNLFCYFQKPFSVSQVDHRFWMSNHSQKRSGQKGWLHQVTTSGPANKVWRSKGSRKLFLNGSECWIESLKWDLTIAPNCLMLDGWWCMMVGGGGLGYVRLCRFGIALCSKQKYGQSGARDSVLGPQPNCFKDKIFS